MFYFIVCFQPEVKKILPQTPDTIQLSQADANQVDKKEMVKHPTKTNQQLSQSSISNPTSKPASVPSSSTKKVSIAGAKTTATAAEKRVKMMKKAESVAGCGVSNTAGKSRKTSVEHGQLKKVAGAGVKIIKVSYIDVSYGFFY